MNTDVIQEFLIKLGFQVDQTSLNGFLGTIESASTKIAAFGAAFTAASAIVVKSIHEIAEENKQLGLLAEEMGSAADAIDDFIDTADMLGISNEDAIGSLKTFSRNVADAALGIGRAKLVFEKLNIEVKDASGKMRAATDVMADLQEKMQGMTRIQQIRTMEKLGLDPKLLAMFNDAFGNTKYIADELGKIDVASGFDLTKSIEESKKFSHSWKDMTVEINLLHMTFSKMYESIAVKMMPMLSKGVEAFAKMVEKARRIVMDNGKQIQEVLSPIIETILKIGTAFMKITSTALSVVYSVLKPIFDLLISVNKETNGWAGYIAAALVAWKVFNLGFLATPLGMVLSFSLALLALIDDFQAWKEGGTSLFDWSSVMPIIQTMINLVTDLWGAFKTLISGIVNLAKAFIDLFRGDTAGFFDEWTKSGEKFLDTIKSIWNTIKDFGSFGESLFNADWGKIGDAISQPFTSKPTPSIAGASSVNQSTVINVNGASNPQATAYAVKAHQTEVNAQVTRNMRAQAR